MWHTGQSLVRPVANLRGLQKVLDFLDARVPKPRQCLLVYPLWQMTSLKGWKRICWGKNPSLKVNSQKVLPERKAKSSLSSTKRKMIEVEFEKKKLFMSSELKSNFLRWKLHIIIDLGVYEIKVSYSHYCLPLTAWQENVSWKV